MTRRARVRLRIQTNYVYRKRLTCCDRLTKLTRAEINYFMPRYGKRQDRLYNRECK
jgi:hypothetical protein